MTVWIPDPAGTKCTRHQVVFQKGGACAHCYSDPPPVDDGADAEIDELERLAEGLPTTFDHEREFNRLADLAAEWAVAEEAAAARWIPDEDSVSNGPSRSTAAKLLDTAIKARRAAHTCARQREDWILTKKTERAARDLEARH